MARKRPNKKYSKREMIRAWKQGYRSGGSAKRLVFRYLKGIGYSFSGFPKFKELADTLEQRCHYTFPQRFWTNKMKVIYFAENLTGCIHFDPDIHKLKGKASTSRYNAESKHFLESDKWYALRKVTLERHGAKCMRCNITDEHAVLTVDHIQPRRLRPDLSLKEDNLQVLCRSCNSQKGTRDTTDYRPKSPPRTMEPLPKQTDVATGSIEL